MKATNNTTVQPSVLRQSFVTLLSGNFSEFPNFENASAKDLEYYMNVMTEEIQKLHTDIVVPMREFRLKLKEQKNELKKALRSAEKPAKETKEKKTRSSKNERSEIVGYILSKSGPNQKEWKTPVTKNQLDRNPELAEKLISVEQVNKELDNTASLKPVPKPSAKATTKVSEKNVKYNSTSTK